MASGIKAYDGFNHSKTENPQIEICLNCKRVSCKYGTCELMKAKRDRVIKRTYSKANGEVKVSYITILDRDTLRSSSNIHIAKKFTEPGAKKFLKQALKHLKKGTLEIVRKDEEVERISKENRKSVRGKIDLHTDCNGNLLGRR